MNSSDKREVPADAIKARDALLELLNGKVVGVYLFGSAVMGGLRVNSDVDVLAIVKQSLDDSERKRLGTRLMLISGKVGNLESIRPLELTIVNMADVVPWRYPPESELLYGEWLRNEFAQGRIPRPAASPDLTIVLRKVRENSIPLFGPNASEILDPVPIGDIQRAIGDCLPELIGNLKGDERNVILTLARMWLTATTGEIASKDAAAEWAVTRLPCDLAGLLDVARRAYLGQCDDNWEGRESEIGALVRHMRRSVEGCLRL